MSKKKLKKAIKKLKKALKAYYKGNSVSIPAWQNIDKALADIAITNDNLFDKQWGGYDFED